MNRFLVSLMVWVMLGIAVACPMTAGAAEKKIAVMWVGKSEMPTRWARAMLPRLKEIAPTLGVTFKPELPDMAAAGKLFRELEGQMDGIVFMRSSGAEFLGKAHAKVPCFIGAANDPRELGVIKNLEAPEGNITGATYFVPYEKRFAAIRTLFPAVKSIGLLLQKGHAGAPIDQKGTREQCEKLGVQYHDVMAASAEELVAGTKELVGRVRLFIIASNQLVLDETPRLVEISRSSKVPLFSYGDSPVSMGALAGLAARDDVLGRMLADSIVEVVVKGTPVAQVPVKTDPNPQIALNEAEVEFFGLKLPPSVLSEARIFRKR